MTDPASQPSAGAICYIDDEVNLLSVVRRGLERRGWTVVTIGDPFDALRQVRKAEPRIIILDLLMPGMDGFQVLRALKSSSDLGHIPVVIASARDAQKDKEMAFSMGAAAFLVKPFGVKELLLTIESVLGPIVAPPDPQPSPDTFPNQGG
ncbi:MAG: response regulator [Candidatus Brocadiae bacterium]|nr:response regulator [Candidatus Brocadiia bacterium]